MSETERATVAGGCFWCIEAAMAELDGVERATSGYAGGDVPDPSYKEVCSGTTGHAEVVDIEYDPSVLSFEDILEVFFTIHNPTTKNRQGPDVGSQYRSAIFYHNDTQREQAEQVVQRLEDAEVYEDSIVTEIEPLETFYPAEAAHQNYFQKHPERAYCQAHVAPKVEKVRAQFG